MLPHRSKPSDNVGQDADHIGIRTRELEPRDPKSALVSCYDANTDKRKSLTPLSCQDKESTEDDNAGLRPRITGSSNVSLASSRATLPQCDEHQ